MKRYLYWVKQIPVYTKLGISVKLFSYNSYDLNNSVWKFKSKKNTSAISTYFLFFSGAHYWTYTAIIYVKMVQVELLQHHWPIPRYNYSSILWAHSPRPIQFVLSFQWYQDSKQVCFDSFFIIELPFWITFHKVIRNSQITQTNFLWWLEKAMWIPHYLEHFFDKIHFANLHQRNVA